MGPDLPWVWAWRPPAGAPREEGLCNGVIIKDKSVFSGCLPRPLLAPEFPALQTPGKPQIIGFKIRSPSFL